MNEIDIKINSGNPVLIAQVISKLVDTILERNDEEKEVDVRRTPEYKYLEQKCAAKDPYVNTVACMGIVKLVENTVITFKPTITNFILAMSCKT